MTEQQKIDRFIEIIVEMLHRASTTDLECIYIVALRLTQGRRRHDA